MNPSTTQNLFCFGLGYVGRAVAEALVREGTAVGGTCRTPEKQKTLAAEGWDVTVFDAPGTVPAAPQALTDATHVLVTIPPQKDIGDAVLHNFHGALQSAKRIEWLGYISTTGVYGDQGGAWVDETAALTPGFAHQQRRAEAEAAWMLCLEKEGLPVHRFRLAGIYGPGRNPLLKIRNGTAHRIDKPGLVFGRIHIDDVVQVVTASMRKPNPGAVYNVADDCPASPREVVEYACGLLNVEPPPLTAFEDARLSEQGRSFYLTNKRVNNGRIKTELGVRLRHPDYRSGLSALLGDST